MRRRIPDRYVRCDEKSILKPAKPVLLNRIGGAAAPPNFTLAAEILLQPVDLRSARILELRSRKCHKAFISGAFRPFLWPRRRRWRSRSTSPCSFFPSCACKNTWLPPQARCPARWRYPNRSYFLLLRSARSALRCRRQARPARTATGQGTAPTSRRARALWTRRPRRRAYTAG